MARTADSAPAVGRDPFAAYTKDVSRTSLLSREEERNLAKAKSAGDRTAAAKLVTSNLRLVMKIAGEYRSYGLPFADLVQEGNIGLMKAVAKFDPAFGTRLSTYASWWIRALMSRFVLDNWSLVKIGTSQAQRKLFFRLRSVRAQLTNVNGPARDEDVALLLEVPVKAVREMRQRMLPTFSLDKPVASANGDLVGNAYFGDLVRSARPDPEAATFRTARDAAVSALLQKELDSGRYDTRERYIIEERILAEDPLTLAEIGRRFAISRERIRQIETRVKDKLRGAFLRAGIGPEDSVNDLTGSLFAEAGISPKERSLL